MLGIYCKNHHKPPQFVGPSGFLQIWTIVVDHIISYHIIFISYHIIWYHIIPSSIYHIWYIIYHMSYVINQISYIIYIYIYYVYIYIWCLFFFLLLLFIIISYLISKIIPWNSSPCAPGPHGDHLRLGQLRGLRGGHGAAVQPRGRAA